MESLEIAKAYMQIVPTTQNFKQQLTNDINPAATTAGNTAGKSLGSSIAKGLAGAAVGITVAAGAAFAGAIHGARDFASSLDEIDKASIRMQITPEYYQELAYAAELSGVSMSMLERAARSLGDSDLSFEDALNQILSIEDAAGRSQAAIEIFGESVAYNITPLINAGAEGFASMTEEANKLGLVMDEDMVKSGANMNDSFTKVDKSIQAIKNGIIMQFMPSIQNMLDWVVAHMPEIQGVFEDVAGTIGPLIAALAPVFGAVCVAIKWLWDNILKKVINAIVEAIKWLQENWEEIWNDMGIFFEDVWHGIANFFIDIANWVIDLVNWNIDGFNKIFDIFNDSAISHIINANRIAMQGGSLVDVVNGYYGKGIQIQHIAHWDKIERFGADDPTAMEFISPESRIKEVGSLDQNLSFAENVGGSMSQAVREGMSGMQVVLDSGALVGGLYTGIDQNIGTNVVWGERGVATP